MFRRASPNPARWFLTKALDFLWVPGPWWASAARLHEDGAPGTHHKRLPSAWKLLRMGPCPVLALIHCPVRQALDLRHFFGRWFLGVTQALPQRLCGGCGDRGAGGLHGTAAWTLARSSGPVSWPRPLLQLGHVCPLPAPVLSESRAFVDFVPACSLSFVISALPFEGRVQLPRGPSVCWSSLPTARTAGVQQGPGTGPRAAALLTTCWGRGMHGQGRQPQISGSGNCLFSSGKKKNHLEDFFFFFSSFV